MTCSRYLLRVITSAFLLLMSAHSHAGSPYPAGSIRAALFSGGDDKDIVLQSPIIQSYTEQAEIMGEEVVSESSGKGDWGYDRRFWRDIKPALEISWSDLKHIYLSPSRLNKKSVLWLGGIVGAGAIIYIYDQEIYDAIDRSRDDKLYKPIRELGEEFEQYGHMGNTNKYYLGAIAAGYLIRYKPLVMIPAEILECQLIAGVAKDAGNILVGRSRPAAGLGPRAYKLNDGTSFPSGHAKNIVIAARVISRRINFLPVRVAAYTIAGSVSLQRISSDNHWPSDVYSAVVLGWLCSNELVIKHDGGRMKITPDASNPIGLRLTYTF